MSLNHDKIKKRQISTINWSLNYRVKLKSYSESIYHTCPGNTGVKFPLLPCSVCGLQIIGYFSYGEDVRTYLCALEAGWILIMSELLHESRPRSEQGPPNLKGTFRVPQLCPTSQPLGHYSPFKNGSAPAERYHTLNTAASGCCTGMIHHWSADIWCWRIFIFVWRRHENVVSK